MSWNAMASSSGEMFGAGSREYVVVMQRPSTSFVVLKSRPGPKRVTAYFSSSAPQLAPCGPVPPSSNGPETLYHSGSRHHKRASRHEQQSRPQNYFLIVDIFLIQVMVSRPFLASAWA